jgi:uracil-DNA glycosylase family protein
MPRKIFTSAAPFIPQGASLSDLAEAAQSCKGCELYKNATQAVLGAGASRARVVMVGEQPGDSEDRTGEPFVGPAGRLLDRALGEAGLVRAEVYITNAVKHFKFEERGKRRIHKKPSTTEINACRPWLKAELELIRPEVIVCLGATATVALTGKSALRDVRGQFLEHPLARAITATMHPSAILRASGSEQRQQEYDAFLADLIAVERWLKHSESR